MKKCSNRLIFHTFFVCHLKIDAVADPDPNPAYHFDAYPDAAYHFDAYPNPAYHFDAYPDAAYHFDAYPDADPDPDFYLMRIRKRIQVTKMMRIHLDTDP